MRNCAAVQSRPFNIAQALQEAVSLHQQGRLREAEKLYARALKAAPDNFDALHLLGLVKAQSGHMGEAYRLMSAALKINPGAPDALVNIANVLHALKRDAEALDCLDKALALRPGDLDTLLYRGNALSALDRTQEAISCFDAVLARNPRHDPGYSDALLNRGTALAKLGRHTQALADFDAIIAHAPNHVGALYNRGTAQLDLNRYAQALETFDRMLAHAPQHARAWNNRGRALQALNRHQDAVASFEKAIALEKDYADAHSNLALSLLTLGELQRGFAQYEWRWKRTGMPDTRSGYRGRLWLGEFPLGQRTILLPAEQGLGDTIQFVRYAPRLARAGATLMLEVQPELKALLASVEGVASCHARGEALPAHDIYCPLGSLPLALKTGPTTIPADIPYLRADDAHIAKWRPTIEALPENAWRWPGPVTPVTPTTATVRSISNCSSRCSRSKAFPSSASSATCARTMPRYWRGIPTSPTSATSLLIWPTPPPSSRWLTSPSRSTRRSFILPGPWGARCGCCCRFHRTGDGRSPASTPLGIRRRDCFANLRSPIGLA